MMVIIRGQREAIFALTRAAGKESEANVEGFMTLTSSFTQTWGKEQKGEGLPKSALAPVVSVERGVASDGIVRIVFWMKEMNLLQRSFMGSWWWWRTLLYTVYSKILHTFYIILSSSTFYLLPCWSILLPFTPYSLLTLWLQTPTPYCYSVHLIVPYSGSVIFFCFTDSILPVLTPGISFHFSI